MVSRAEETNFGHEEHQEATLGLLESLKSRHKQRALTMAEEGQAITANESPGNPAMSTMMNQIPAMMYSWQMNPRTGESRFLYVSDYCNELLGVTPEEATRDAGRIVNLIIGADVPAFSAATVQSMNQLTLFNLKVRMRRRSDGMIVTVQFKSRPRRQTSGAGEVVVIWDGVVMEVATSQQHYSGPQHLKQHGVQEPPHDKEDAVKRLVDAERSLTEWLSHEVRNPLSVTMEALQTLQELTLLGNPASHDGYSATECHQVMAESITYVVDLLNNMMDLDQVHQGQMPVVSAPCHVRDDILLPTYRMMQRLRPRDGPVQLRMASSLRIDAQYIDHGTGPSVLEDVTAHVDKLRLRQVLTNLIANAFHFTTEGFVEVDMQIQEKPTVSEGWGSASSLWGQEVTSVAGPVQPKMLSFHVRDSGCGVDPSAYETLFTRWEQLGSSRNGTGIGLCLCQALVKAMGGSIRLNTNYDSGLKGHPGAEFIVEVPIESDSSAGAATSITKTELSVPVPAPMLPFSSLSAAVLASSSQTQKALLVDKAQPVFKRPPPLATPTPTASVPSYAQKGAHRGSTGSLPPGAIPLDSISSRSSSSSFTAASLAAAMTMSTPTMSAAAAAPGTAAATLTRRESSPSSLGSQKTTKRNRFFKGKYRFLIVDDEKMGRKFLKRRFSRLFPEATIDEVASGEDALVEAAVHQYDVITMDHFMAVNEMNGDETIRELRSRLHSDALIIGISGNDKQVEHLQAGADSFFQKPLPNDGTLVESMQLQLAPPAGWKVLILSEDAAVASMLTERLYQVAAPHFTTREEAKKRWKLLSRSPASATEAVDLLTSEVFDLVVFVESENGDDESVQKHLRQMAEKGETVVVTCTQSETMDDVVSHDASCGDEPRKEVSITWSLSTPPTVQQMRQSLCKALLAVRNVQDKSPSTSARGASLAAPTHLPPKRTNSGVAKSA